VELLIEAARRTGLPLRLAGNETTHPAIRPGDPVECVLTPTRDDLMAFYRGARMLAAPSLWREAFGIVAAEAMSHGVPVIASRIGGLSDVVRDGRPACCSNPMTWTGWRRRCGGSGTTRRSAGASAQPAGCGRNRNSAAKRTCGG